jgi:hypothetical protein
MSDNEDAELVMPFVVTKSRGGPYDDDAYVAGFEAGRLDAILTNNTTAIVVGPVHSLNRDQLDLIAMQHGYTASFVGNADDEPWVQMTLMKERNDRLDD